MTNQPDQPEADQSARLPEMLNTLGKSDLIDLVTGKCDRVQELEAALRHILTCEHVDMHLSWKCAAGKFDPKCARCSVESILAKGVR